VLLVHLEDQDGVRAYDARCPHARTLLADGPLVDGLIECPMHGALFHAADGTLEPGPVQCAGLTAFPVRVESGHIAVDLPEQPSEPRPHRPSSWGSFGTRTATSTSQP
jgi:nitrite reductase/ring-hydroxylating ferredoxin subunit